MTDRVFVGGAHFSCRVVGASRHEDRVVAETVGSRGVRAIEPANDPAVRGEFATVGEDGNRRAFKRCT